VRPVIALLALAVVAGCGHGEPAPKLKVSLLAKLVLQPRDLPHLRRFDVGPIGRFDAPEGPRADPKRFGRLGGWKADYKRSDVGRKTRGPLLVSAKLDLFGDEDGAKRDLGLYRDQLEALRKQDPRSVRRVRVSGLGDEALGITQLQAGAPPIRYYTLAWRKRNVSALLAASGFDGRIRLEDAVGLARTEDRRIAAAAR
jgi:hypothetical protein